MYGARSGLLLIGSAVVALILANSSGASAYQAFLHRELGPLSVMHCINDALMTVFFLSVGLEIKHEALSGELATPRSRMLPGLAALGGMAVPAAVYLTINATHPDTCPGWAIPAATDIAFALAVVGLLGKRVPASLKAFLTALAIVDDLGAVLIIGVFYTSSLQPLYLMASLVVVCLMIALNRRGFRKLAPYAVLGILLWIGIRSSGVHPTLAGVMTAWCIPLRDARVRSQRRPRGGPSPFVKLESMLRRLVPFVVLPLFGFANAGLSFDQIGPHQWLAPTMLGVTLGLLLGKVVGVFGAAWLAIRMGWAPMPRECTTGQLFATARLCGIGFTMSLFIAMLAFVDNPSHLIEAKLGILLGSVLAGVAGAGGFIRAHQG